MRFSSSQRCHVRLVPHVDKSRSDAFDKKSGPSQGKIKVFFKIAGGLAATASGVCVGT
jgi:hypothetical protein